MALKPDRNPVEYDISHLNRDVAEAGVVMCYKTAGSGVALGDTQGEVQLAANPSGLTPAGVLENDFVDIDETVRHRNFHKNEHVIGDPATLIKQGWVVTNKVFGTPSIGDTAYLHGTGIVTDSPGLGGVVNTPKVGQFAGIKDADGYIKLNVHLPVV